MRKFTIAAVAVLAIAGSTAVYAQHRHWSFNHMRMNPEDRAAFAGLDRADWWGDPQMVEIVREPLLRAAAWYFLRARTSQDTPLDPVARFHLGNGARLERLNVLADTSTRGLQQSYGLMVNYLYDLDDIEKNHEAYAQQHAVIAAGSVNRLVRAPLREVTASDA